MKQIYAAPQLKEYGSVEKLTLDPGSNNDFGLSTACNAGGNANPCSGTPGNSGKNHGP